jgi:hypothetical protein
VREFSVTVEGRLVNPPRVDEKEPGIAGGTKLLEIPASGFSTGGFGHLVEGRYNGIFLPRKGVEPPYDEEFGHVRLSPGWNQASPINMPVEAAVSRPQRAG